MSGRPLDDGPILEARGLSKRFRGRRGHGDVRAVDGVDFSLPSNSVLALVGESGCGKSTIARLLLRLAEPSSGEILFDGRDALGFRGRALKDFRRAVQIVFQDPFASLNPRRSVYQAVSEPLRVLGGVRGRELRARVSTLLERVGLNDVLDRYPHEFSGGQRQRICIARALAVDPRVIVADEPLSALDVSVQAQILNLLIELKRERAMSYVFISHDLRVVEYLSDEVCVMYLGRIVERAPVEELFARPRHPYTQMLLESAPKMIPGGRPRAPLSGEVPSPMDIPMGCAFHPRCPRRFEPCDMSTPELLSIEPVRVACHLYG